MLAMWSGAVMWSNSFNLNYMHFSSPLLSLSRTFWMFRFVQCSIDKCVRHFRVIIIKNVNNKFFPGWLHFIRYTWYAHTKRQNLWYRKHTHTRSKFMQNPMVKSINGWSTSSNNFFYICVERIDNMFISHSTRFCIFGCALRSQQKFTSNFSRTH